MNAIFVSTAWLIAPLAYLLGAIPFGLLIVKALGGPDIREIGSGNIGAANVIRNAGTFAGILTLASRRRERLSRRVARRAFHQRQYSLDDDRRRLRRHRPHVSLWLGFKGGKGVATGLGVFLPICWQAVAAAVVLWLLVVIFWRYSSLGSISAAVAMPAFCVPALRARPRAGRSHHIWHGADCGAGPGQTSPKYRAPGCRGGDRASISGGKTTNDHQPARRKTLAQARPLKSTAISVSYSPTPVLSSRCIASLYSLAFY